MVNFWYFHSLTLRNRDREGGRRRRRRRRYSSYWTSRCLQLFKLRTTLTSDLSPIPNPVFLTGARKVQEWMTVEM